jgi:dTDP-glucose pyrophosphorylase
VVPLKAKSLPPSATIRDAVALIEESRRGIATVTDGTDALLGTITDGDIRRLILRGGSLDSRAVEAMNGSPLTAPADTSDRDLVAMLQERGLEALPLIDAGGKFAGIAHLRDLLPELGERGGAEGFVAAVVMAGGEGTRLRPITETIPKPMIEVGGMPMIERHIRHLARAGVRRVFIAVNYLAHAIESHLSVSRPPGIAIDYLREDRKLGTAGALSLLPPLEAGPLLVLNADVIHAADYGNLLAYHVAQGAALTVAAIEHHVQIPYGVIRADGDRIVGLEEKPSQRFLCNAGIYVLSPEMRQHIARNRPVDMTDIILELTKREASVAVFPMHEYWADIADADDLARVRREVRKLDGTHGG